MYLEIYLLSFGVILVPILNFFKLNSTACNFPSFLEVCENLTVSKLYLDCSWKNIFHILSGQNYYDNPILIKFIGCQTVEYNTPRTIC